MLSREIKHYLKEHSIPYSVISHSTAYTAAQTAQSAHVSGKNLAKVIVVKMDGKFSLIALPAHEQLDLQTLKKETKCKNIEIAHEYEFSDKFLGCEVGAMPPFGELFGMEVYAAESLKNQNWIAFNGGNHNDLIQMSCTDFLKLVHPKFLSAC